MFLSIEFLSNIAFLNSFKKTAQEEREFAVKCFKEGKADVLVATDIASKGLDFNEIQHVINFDMPKEIEDYGESSCVYTILFNSVLTFFKSITVHRIGRTGRSGKTGVATTFINRSCSEQILLDLKYLLREAKQRVPPVLEALEDPTEKLRGIQGIELECTFCGGLGHRITNVCILRVFFFLPFFFFNIKLTFHTFYQCPKLDQQRRQQMSTQRSMYGNDSRE